MKKADGAILATKLKNALMREASKVGMPLEFTLWGNTKHNNVFVGCELNVFNARTKDSIFISTGNVATQKPMNLSLYRHDNDHILGEPTRIQLPKGKNIVEMLAKRVIGVLRCMERDGKNWEKYRENEPLLA